MRTVTEHHDTIPTPRPSKRTLARTKFLVDGVNEATLKIVEFDDGDFGVVRNANGRDSVLHRSGRISELRHFAVCALAQATAFEEIATKAHLGETPRKAGRPKGSTKTPPRGKYGKGTPRKSGVTNLTVNGQPIQ